MIRMQPCSTCRYFERIDEQHDEYEPGTCLRYPPRPRRDDQDCVALSVYPLVSPGWTCGEHAGKSAAPR